MNAKKHKFIPPPPFFFTVSVAIFCLIACSDGINDRLEGKWQLQQVESPWGKEKADTLFYNFLTSLFMYQVYHAEADTFSHCYGFKLMETTNRLKLELTGYSISLAKFLPQTDWEGPQRSFIVEKITDNRLVLVSGEKRYTFRRF
ncbi:MAG: lipocalin-like domain-containing protein [Tannerellaceae bacterium]|jgi:hypothetical protein|nr:lipocalin-like domain-containing protein [Tannerellaceae bacterium]